ncbi:MAG TPA: hypothetical protein VFB62_00620 [Polyangiaceae bacterium]|jgi:hypothetical protein|nr:hypothetical protein [Polyangiaceae bacterium]
MPEVTELGLLLEKIASDGMIIRRVTVPVQDVVFVKSVLEAYPGLAAVHAERIRGASKTPNTSLVVATTAELAGELDEVLSELSITPSP